MGLELTRARREAEQDRKIARALAQAQAQAKAQPKAADATGKEGEAATERAKNLEKGVPDSQLGPSGKPKIHVTTHPNRKRAQDAAVDRGRRGSAPDEHSNPTVGDPHFTQAGRTIANTTLIHGKVSPKMSNIEIWYGRFDVKPFPGNAILGAAKGAYVNVVALAVDQEGYVRLVKKTMREYEFDVIGYEDVERVKDRRLHPDLEQLARSLTAEAPIQFDEFQGYLSDNDNDNEQ